MTRLGVLLAALLLGSTGCGEEKPQAATSPTPVPSAASTATPPATARPDAPRPVYYVGETPYGPRLFRYFEPNDTGEPDHGTGRVVGLLMATPSDPDYRTLWPPSSLESLAFEGDLAIVTLGNGSLRDRPASMSEQEAELAVQQVVHTVQAAAQRRVAVQFRHDGNPIDQVLGVPAREPLTNAPQLDVLSLVNITNPAEGQVVTDAFGADGLASSFEGSVPWHLVDRAGRVVLRGMGQGSMEDHLTPWASGAYDPAAGSWVPGPIDVSDLAPGTYTFVAMTDDPTGGTEGRGPMSDTRTVIIR